MLYTISPIVVLQTGRIFLKQDQLLIEILRQHESLRHIVAHGCQSHCVHLLLVDLPLMLITGQVRPLRVLPESCTPERPCPWSAPQSP